MPSALICPVGTTPDGRKDILTALSDEIRTVRPDLVLFVVSDDSRANAEIVARESGMRPDACEYLHLPSPHDMNLIFRAINDALRSLRARGFRSTDIAVNYTSGTKVMSAGAVVAAIFNQCREARYLYHEAGADNRTVTTQLEAVSAFRDLLVGRHLLQEMRYQSAADVFSRIDPSLLSEHDVAALKALRILACAYFYWDNFNYAAFVETMRQVPRDAEAVRKFLVSDETLALVEQLAADGAASRITPVSVADMVNNAARRLKEGKYDDAIARVYRALEMLAQWALMEQGIDTDDVDTRRIPPRHRVGFEAMRSLEDGLVRIGMRKAYELLAALGHPLGEQFQTHGALAQTLQRRRNSILAHGVSPLERADCEQLFAAAHDLFVNTIPEFDSLCSRLQFPWLELDGGQRS